jgi:DNA-directed RNA polymerase subunit RPC12/RpoP
MPRNPQADNPDRVCKSCGRPVFRCAECGRTYYPVRTDSETCSVNCRVDRSRRLKKLRAAEAEGAA